MEPSASRQADPGRRGLFVGILAYRWATLAWMTVLALLTKDRLERAPLAFVVVAALILWNVVFTATRAWESAAWRWADLGISTALLLLAGYVMEEGAAAGGAPFFATAYPASSALTVGAAATPGVGLAAAGILSLGLLGSRPVNGVGLDQMDQAQLANMMNGVVYFLAAGGAAGVVSRSLSRSADERDRAIEEAARQRERAARLAEREALGREIHDSVLQSLSLLAKRGRELGTGGALEPRKVGELLDLAGQQEQALRDLLSQPREEPPSGSVSLRTALSAAAYGVDGVPVTVSVTSGVWIAADKADEVVAAISQALENVVQHARATKATVFAEALDDEVVVSVRDDGVGFVFDERRLAEDGKLGVLQSMKGRAEQLGGSMSVHSAPGKGTEIEFRFPRTSEMSDG